MQAALEPTTTSMKFGVGIGLPHHDQHHDNTNHYVHVLHQHHDHRVHVQHQHHDHHVHVQHQHHDHRVHVQHQHHDHRAHVQLERPAVNESDAVVLTFGLTLQQIIDVVTFIIAIVIIVISYLKKFPSLVLIRHLLLSNHLSR